MHYIDVFDLPNAILSRYSNLKDKYYSYGQIRNKYYSYGDTMESNPKDVGQVD